MFTYLKIGAVVGALLLSFGSGWKMRDNSCDAAAAKAEVVALKKTLAITAARVKAAEAANEGNATRSAADAAEIARLQALVDATPENNGACLDADTAGRIGAVK